MNEDLTFQFRQTNARLSSLVNSMASAILIEDQTRHILFLNQEFCKLFEITVPPDQLVGMDCSESAQWSKHLFTDPENFVQRIEVILANNQPVKHEKLAMVSGRILSRTYVPTYLDGIYQGHFWQYDDITEQETIARELEASRDRAWEASRLKSDFLAMMSHEIRTPMNGIIGMSELLLMTNLDEQQRDYASIVHEESHSLLRILNDILDFSKIEAGKIILDAVDFSLHTFINSISDLVKHDTQRKGLAFTLSLPPDSPMLHSDSGRLRQIILNLLNNAIKFTRRGTITLRVTTQAVDEKSLRLFIEVQDTGMGIPPEKIDVLFEPFVQGDGSTTRKYGGTGLGLAIVKRLVELLGGEISCLSEVGQGSLFRVALTLATSQRSLLSSAPSSGVPHPKVQKTPLESLQRILVVEDNPMNQQLIIDYLAGLGFSKVFIAEDGEDAVRLMTNQFDDFDFIFMDVQMPHMDGWTATRAIRALEASSDRHIPIVALTARAMREDREACLAAGMDDYLVKPIEFARLTNVLQKWLPPNTVLLR